MSARGGVTRRERRGRSAGRKSRGSDPLPSSAADIEEARAFLSAHDPGGEKPGTRAGRAAGDWDRPKYSQKQAAFAFGTFALLLLVVITVFLTVFFSDSKAPECLPSSPAPPAPALCPIPWVGYGERCYYLSAVAANWTHSQSHCASQGGSLVTMETQEEKEFVRRYAERVGYWIGVRRESLGRPWMRADESLFDNLFPIRREGLCAYVTGQGFSSTFCANTRYWICSKQAH